MFSPRSEGLAISAAAADSAAETQHIEAETNQILREVLEELGGASDDSGSVRLEIEGVAVLVDPETRIAELRMGEDYDLEVSVDTVVDSYNYADDEVAAQEAAEARVAQTLQTSLEEQRAAAEADARGRLDAGESAVRVVLREATARTEIESLRRKAERMGRVLGVTEDEDPKTGDRQVVIELELG